MTALPTLGGNNGVANEINNRGRVVGFAENDTPDQSCGGQLLEIKPVVWEKGEVQLPTVGGDPDGIATAINDDGQIVGQTGDCVNIFHAVLWHNGAATDLGTLGGLALSPQDINDQGQVVGFALSPDTVVAFLWQNGVATNLGTLPPDVFSLGIAINNKGQIVGDSCDQFFACSAFLWQNGTMTEINTLVHDPSAPFLENANSIDARGLIAGKTTVQGTPLADAFVATPSPGKANSKAVAPAAPVAPTQRQKVVLPENIRRMLRGRTAGWYANRSFGTRPPQ